MARSTMSSSAKSSCWLIESQALSMAVVALKVMTFIERRICRLLDRRGKSTGSVAGGAVTVY
jgi:hypothetical protein